MLKQKGWVVGLLAVTVLVASSGCATVYHWERVGAPPNEQGSIDVPMLVLDIIYIAAYGAGLIGLLVDFLTGAIYIPKSHQPWNRGARR